MKRIFTRAFAFLLCAVMLATCAPLDGFVFEAEAASYKVGDIIEFGSYPQSQNADGTFNVEPIQWRVLSSDSNGILVLSEYILDRKQFHNTTPYPTWANSTIRTWLNSEFYNIAFSSSEKSKIATSLIATDDLYGDDGGVDTYDKIFLLSYKDVKTTAYGFSSDTSRQAKATAYAAYNYSIATPGGTLHWWLRSPGYPSNCALYVYKEGSVSSGTTVTHSGGGIRPALVINQDSVISKSKSYNSYAVKVVDNASGKPISGANVVFDGKSVGTTGVDGKYTLKIGETEDSSKSVTFTKSGYSTETRRLYELNSYATNTIAMQNGVDISQSLASLQFAKEKVTGPSVTILGKTFSLFSFDAGIEIAGFSVKAKQNTKEKTIEYIIGIGDGVDVSTDEKFSENYKEFKEFFNCFSNKANYNNYRKIRSKLNKFDGDVGFDADLSVAGYMEFDYSTGDLIYKEGGMVVTAEAAVSQDVPFAYICYATFKIGGEIEGKLYIQQQSSGEMSPGGSFGIKVKPSIGVGAKLLSKDVASVEAGINGSIGGKITLPASALREALSLDISAGCYVKAKALWALEAKWSKTLNCNLYPNFGDITINSADAVIDHNDFEPIARDYLNAIQIETQSIDETINNTSVYPYADPQLVELSDGKIVALWLGDNGTKSTMNLTTLYYSVYENGTWSAPAAVCESGLADNEPKIATDGEKVYVLWQRGNEVFADDASLDYMLAHTDLVYAVFDGEWTQPVVVGNVGSGMYSSTHNIAAENGTVAITWAEDSENFAEDTDGTTTIYTQQNIGGEWGTVNTATTLSNMSSLTIGFVDGVATIAYSTDLDGDSTTTGGSEVYIGSTQLTSDTTDDYDVTYQNGEFYYLSGGYLANNNIATNLYVGGNYSVLNNGTTTAVVYPVVDGFKSELYVAYKKDDGYSTPVALTSIGKHVADYSAIIDSENTIVAAMAVRNIDENATGYPYTSTDLIVDNIGQLADLEMNDIVYYDTDSVVAGNEITFTTTIKNIGTAAVNGYTVNLKDASGTLVAAREYEGSIASGETIEANVIYTLPDDFRKQTYTVEVVANDDENEKNNTATVEIGYADIQVVSCEIQDGKIVAIVTNNGYETVTGAKADISRFTTESTLLGTIAIGELAPGEVETVEYILPASQLLFDTPYSSNRFIVEVASDTEELNTVNNTAEVLHSPKAVEGISLNVSEVTIGIGTTHQLLATVAPSDAYNKVVHWVSDSTNIVEVDEYSGKLTAVGSGTATITAITDDGGYVYSCLVRVVTLDNYLNYYIDNFFEPVSYDVTRTPAVSVIGWAYNKFDEEVQLYYRLDSAELISLESIARPDVQAVFPECTQLECGFNTQINIYDLCEGEHTIEIIAETCGSSKVIASTSFTVIRPDFNCVSEAIADDELYDLTIKQEMYLKGWAYSLEGEDVTLYYKIDDGSLSQLKPKERLDVVNAWNCSQLSCGYEEYVSLSKLSVGEHTISIIAQTKTHSQVIASSSFTIVCTEKIIPNNGSKIDYVNKIIYGLDAGIESPDDYLTVFDEEYLLDCEPTQNGFGTGTLAMLTVNSEIVESYTIVIYGDVNGDAWYDGEDAFIVNLIVNGMLDRDDVGEAIWTAADCNHDGVIDEADVDLLTGAGLKLNNVDQSKTVAELATNSDYIEYAMLIDQSAGMSVEPDVDNSQQGTIDTNTTPENPADEINIEAIFTFIFDLINKLINFIFSFVIK